MEVESFACDEVASEPIEAAEAALAIINELELDGQNSILNPDRPRERNPFRLIRADEEFVYRVLCPEVSDLKTYSGSPIPLRVLEIAKVASDLGVFTKGLRVWDRASSSVKDPVLVGLAPVPNQNWGERTFILARWGETLETFDTLARRALEAWRDARASALAKLLAKANAALPLVPHMTLQDAVRSGPHTHPDCWNL